MNPQQIVEDIVASQLKPEADIPDFTIGDTINVHVRIVEGDKERIQVYQGVLIATKGRGVNKTITVRRIVANEGVERVFPLHSPRLAQIEVVRRSDARIIRRSGRLINSENNSASTAAPPPRASVSQMIWPCASAMER